MLCITLNFSVGAAESINKLNKEDAEKICQAIYLAEGGSRAKVPYGILSVKTKDPKQVCLNTIHNNYLRWQKDGRPSNFIIFLGDRYCPPSSDPNGNKNWKKNVTYFLGKDFVKNRLTK
jgi:hypothetical protein